MKIIESAKNHPYRTGAILALVLGISATETTGYVSNPLYDIPKNACVSPPAVSKTYVDHATNLLLQTYTGIDTTGIVASGQVPHDAYGVQASFKAPNANAEEWSKNASSMTKADKAGHFALKMAIGPGEVEFGVRVVAPEGSELCNKPPQVNFEHYNQAEFFNADGTLPWRNPGNVVVNLFR